MGKVERFQAYGISGQDTNKPTIHYESSETAMTSHKIVDGVETTESGGVHRALARTPEAGVNVGGISVAPHEAEAFRAGIEQDYEAMAKAEADRAEFEVQGFEEATVMVLNDLDQGDLANAVNLAVKGELDDEALADAVKSLGFADKDQAAQVGKNIWGSLEKSFGELSEEEGWDAKIAWDAMVKHNPQEAGKAFMDWVYTGGVDNERIRKAIHDGLNAYGNTDNQALIEVLENDGYEVKRNPSDGLAIKGNEFSDWVTWRDFRKVYMQ